MNKAVLSTLLREIGLIHFADTIRFYFHRARNRKSNRRFRLNNPHIELPPDYLIYESFQINYNKYYFGGLETAKWLVGQVESHMVPNSSRVLDWGCGPGRVIRHLPPLLGPQFQVYGTDYNLKSVKWCKKNLASIHFNHNTGDAKLPYANDFFDLIYGISVLTHLSRVEHIFWIEELSRVLKPGGLLLLTTQGQNFRSKLSRREKSVFDAGRLITRGKTKQGHRTFSAFHPVPFMETLFRSYQILEHIVPDPLEGKALPQDVWILKKS